MNWQHIERQISFHDLESCFQFRTVDIGVELSFVNWQERVVRIVFQNVSHFVCSPLGGLSPLDQCPGEGMFIIESSPLIPKLRECHVLGRAEPATHYMLVTNSSHVEWCEVVAEAYTVAMEDRDG